MTGALDIDDRAARYIDVWRGTPAAAVTVRNLLSNDSGREWSRLTDYVGLIGANDRSSYAVALRQADRPGIVWDYNNAAIQTLDRVLTAATGMPTADYAEERLFGPLGMADTRMTGDSSGLSTSTAFGLETTCRDLARFGLLFESGGAWEGEQIVPRSWVRGSRRPPVAAAQPVLRAALVGELRRLSLCRAHPATSTQRSASAARCSWSTRDPTPSWSGSATPGDGDYGVADAARIVTDALVRQR